MPRGVTTLLAGALLLASTALIGCASSAADSAEGTDGAARSNEGVRPHPGAPSAPAVGCPGYPAPACTGVSPGTRLTTLPLNSDGIYRVTVPGTVLDRVYIASDLLITAPNVTIRNSQIDGSVLDSYADQRYSFTIIDSTVGRADTCQTLPAIGDTDYTAIRVHVRGHGDGFRVSGDHVTIRDSYVRLCSRPGDHSDGIQTYGGGRHLTFHHNTVDQRYARDITAPIFITDPHAADVSVTDNLVMGGTYSIQVRNAKGRVVVRGNRLVDHSWVYGPVDSECAAVEWSDNTLVTIDADYRITSTVGPLRCDG
ncbi:right-handed parallel beta-helix repeat-containing protein [Sphaerimonospora cavernae]|uniref:Right-handed parallel beta-helix repeat-containing protein n=1 Tax=Sphaerimonospora cavernae TaxID=1740611 RepID=A0ABV6U6V9_9ACTN